MDEKPKVEFRQINHQSLNKVWLAIISAMSLLFLAGVILIFVLVSSESAPTDLEMTGTYLPLRNATLIARETQTQLAIETLPEPQRTLIAIYRQQTPLAATQQALATSQAQAAATLTAVVTSTP